MTVCFYQIIIHSKFVKPGIYNKCQSNLATSDVALLSYSPGGSTHCKFTSVLCIRDPYFGGRRGHRRSAMVLFRLPSRILNLY